MARTLTECTGAYWKLAWFWTISNLAVHARERDVPYSSGNDLEGMDCSGMFTYLMNTMGFTYEDRTAQCMFDELFVFPGLTPPLGAGIKALFYGYSKTEIVHVAFPVTMVSKAWLIHSTDQYQGIDGHSGLRVDRLADLKDAWTNGRWYTRWCATRTLWAYQGVASGCT